MGRHLIAVDAILDSSPLQRWPSLRDAIFWQKFKTSPDKNVLRSIADGLLPTQRGSLNTSATSSIIASISRHPPHPFGRAALQPGCDCRHWSCPARQVKASAEPPPSAYAEGERRGAQLVLDFCSIRAASALLRRGPVEVRRTKRHDAGLRVPIAGSSRVAESDVGFGRRGVLRQCAACGHRRQCESDCHPFHSRIIQTHGSPFNVAATAAIHAGRRDRTCWQEDRALPMVCPLESQRRSDPNGIFPV